MKDMYEGLMKNAIFTEFLLAVWMCDGLQN